MITKHYTIVSPEGIHARPATALIRLVRQFKSVVHLQKGDTVVRLTSLLTILGLGAKNGETIAVIVEGEDEEDAAAAIDAFFREEKSNQ